MMTGVHQVLDVCTVHTVGHEAPRSSYVRMCVWYTLLCMSQTCKLRKIFTVDPLLKDTVNEGHNRNDLHTKDKFNHQNGLCYCANTCFISEEWMITLQ